MTSIAGNIRMDIRNPETKIKPDVQSSAFPPSLTEALSYNYRYPEAFDNSSFVFLPSELGETDRGEAVIMGALLCQWGQSLNVERIFCSWEEAKELIATYGGRLFVSGYGC